MPLEIVDVAIAAQVRDRHRRDGQPLARGWRGPGIQDRDRIASVSGPPVRTTNSDRPVRRCGAARRTLSSIQSPEPRRGRAQTPVRADAPPPRQQIDVGASGPMSRRPGASRANDCAIARWPGSPPAARWRFLTTRSRWPTRGTGIGQVGSRRRWMLATGRPPPKPTHATPSADPPASTLAGNEAASRRRSCPGTGTLHDRDARRRFGRQNRRDPDACVFGRTDPTPGRRRRRPP